MFKPSRKMSLEIVFWLLYFLYEWLDWASYSNEYRKFFIHACWELPLQFSVSYITIHVFFKKYYAKWGAIKFWIYQILMSVTLLLIRRYVGDAFKYSSLAPHVIWERTFSFKDCILALLNVYLILGVYALLYFVQKWNEEKQKSEMLIKEKTLAELEILKAQIKPHFIFNALNNIYSSAIKTSPETAKLVSHLSDFLNYNLYESKEEKVALNYEIIYVSNFIEIQKNRYGEKLDAAINVFDDIDGLTIAPLLLLPLVENCFKHGISNAIEQSWVRVDVSKEEDGFSVKIENSIEGKKSYQGETNGGLGLKNVQKRLELLYPGHHEFSIIEGLNSFLIVLKIKAKR